MNNFNWSKAIGFGILTWGIMNVTLWILGNFQSVNSLLTHSIVAIIGAVAAFLFVRNANPASGAQAAGYGLVWAVIILGLDFFVTQFFDTHIFTAWQYWLGAVLVGVVPWIEAEAQQTFSHQV